jgi:four helix bundle protein
MGEIRTFRDLVAWQRAMDLARAVYRNTARMPGGERFGLTSQIRRAAESVPSNIAEGYGRGSTADSNKVLRISRGSLCEVLTQYELATTMELIPRDPGLEETAAETDRVLHGLIRSREAKQ